MPKATPFATGTSAASTPTNGLTLPAPAKLNLMLHITRQRADGYHELQTLFQLLDLADRLSFAPDPTLSKAEIILQDTMGIPPEQNLITRAAEALVPFAQQPVLIRVTLEKHLPMGGGLGGGSSNAATTLLALNTIWQCNLTVDRLAAIGQHLGADIPLFVRGRSAWAEGIGEALTPVDIPHRWFVVVNPDIIVSTGAIFGAPELTRNSQKTTIRSALEGGGHNDCEPVVRSHYPAIDAMLNAMSEFGTARLTGTGACGFLSFDTRSQADQAAQALGHHYRVFTASGINHSPAHKALTAADGPN